MELFALLTVEELAPLFVFVAIVAGTFWLLSLISNRNSQAEERLRVGAEVDTFVRANVGHESWSSRIEEGEPRKVIADSVAQAYADLVVIGTHGRSGLAKMLLGSVAEQVFRKAPTAVTLYRAERGHVA